jgi:hypothetical protein
MGTFETAGVLKALEGRWLGNIERAWYLEADLFGVPPVAPERQRTFP